MEVVETYRISHTTMALEAFNHIEYNTKIYDVEGIFYSRQTIHQLLEQACALYCTDYRGRINAVREAFKYDRKTPLVISPEEMLYAIPTHSPKNYNCKWIFPDHVKAKDYIPASKELHIYFHNGLKLEVDISEQIYETQVERARNSLVYFANLRKIQLIYENRRKYKKE
ncbi:competence protein ComK [Heyndrickxia sporothermodurans]|uniref:competence protein ComK n=1 Tax=Heyndrickxia TaxID=2837504 RepID=UPI002DB7073E|nr:competence protein ComK [Heyndrickxia sporothermodurans]MEB6548879.1 competence protein ComK [Heyndrickxia sporothermodurans]